MLNPQAPEPSISDGVDPAPRPTRRSFTAEQDQHHPKSTALGPVDSTSLRPIPALCSGHPTRNGVSHLSLTERGPTRAHASTISTPTTTTPASRRTARPATTYVSSRCWPPRWVRMSASRWVRMILDGEGPVPVGGLSLIHISEPTRRTPISYAVFC